jgi:transposase-like protein
MTTTTAIETTQVHPDVERKIEDLGKGEQKSHFIHLRAKGYSFAKIAKELGVAKSTLSNWNQELQEEIAQAKAMELEALQEEYFLLKEGRIKLLGEQLKAIQEEIGNRDLSQVNTDRLLELQLRYFGELKGEYIETGRQDKTGTKLNSGDITQRLKSILERYKAGEIGESQAKLEQTILQTMLKAIEQTELEARMEKLEAVLKSRR